MEEQSRRPDTAAARRCADADSGLREPLPLPQRTNSNLRQRMVRCTLSCRDIRHVIMAAPPFPDRGIFVMLFVTFLLSCRRLSVGATLQPAPAPPHHPGWRCLMLAEYCQKGKDLKDRRKWKSNPTAPRHRHPSRGGGAGAGWRVAPMCQYRQGSAPPRTRLNSPPGPAPHHNVHPLQSESRPDLCPSFHWVQRPLLPQQGGNERTVCILLR